MKFFFLFIHFSRNITDSFKNHGTTLRGVCAHFDAFSMLIPDMVMKCKVSEIFMGVKFVGVDSLQNPCEESSIFLNDDFVGDFYQINNARDSLLSTHHIEISHMLQKE